MDIDKFKDNLKRKFADKENIEVLLDIVDESYYAGIEDGQESGYKNCMADNNDIDSDKLNDAYDEGFGDGRSEGYEYGYGDGESEGGEIAYNDGHSHGHEDGYKKGHTEGFDEGYEKGCTDTVIKLERER